LKTVRKKGRSVLDSQEKEEISLEKGKFAEKQTKFAGKLRKFERNRESEK